MEKDKKKMAVLGALAVVILAVGAFSFMGGGSSDTAATVTAGSTTDKPAEDPATAESDNPIKHELDGLVALNEFGVRDPFAPPIGAAVDEPANDSPETNEHKPTQNNTRPPRMSGGTPPVTPDFGGLSTPFGGGQIVPETPRFRVKGILLGSKPLAVFEDSDGNQRLVPVGGSVDGETQVTGISQGKVTVKQRGKVKTLSIEEEARND